MSKNTNQLFTPRRGKYARTRMSIVLGIAAFGVVALSTGAAAAVSGVDPFAPLAHNHGAQTVDPIEDICKNTKLDIHDGFQEGPACVETEFGEQSTETLNPSLLIVQAPVVARKDRDFTVQVSSQNLVRDRFLAAGAGGYYAEGATLDAQGLTHGHAHMACRSLQGNVAQEPERVPEFFKAIEDGKGSKNPDTFSVTVPANTFKAKGRTNVQCTVWAGDGSHRTPMMQRANQTPAIDSVRIIVVG